MAFKHFTGPRFGTVTVIVSLFFLSTAVRLFHSGEAIAAESSQEGFSQESENEARALSINSSKEDLEKLLKLFAEREEFLKDQEATAEKRLIAIRIAENRLNERIEELATTEAKLRATLALASTAAEGDLAKLTAVYENMKPKVAAAVFGEMAPEFAAGFLGRMRADTAAGIMAGMTPETAYAVSAILAGRNANVPKYQSVEKQAGVAEGAFSE